MQITHFVQPDSPHHIEHFLKRFADLSHAEQVFLLILSVVYKPITLKQYEGIVKQLCDGGFLTHSLDFYVLTAPQRQTLSKHSMLELSQDGIYINRLIANTLTGSLDKLEALGEGASKPKLVSVLMAAEFVTPVVQSPLASNKLVNKRRLIRDFYLLNELDQVQSTLALNKNPQLINLDVCQVLVELLFIPFDLRRFLSLPDTLQFTAFSVLLRLCKEQKSNVQYAQHLLETVCNARSQQGEKIGLSKPSLLFQLLSEQHLFAGRLDKFNHTHLKQDSSCYGLQLSAAYSFVNNDIKQAYYLFQQALAAKGKFSRKRKQYLGGQLGFIHKLCVIAYAHQFGQSDYDNVLGQLYYEHDDKECCDTFYLVSGQLAEVVEQLDAGSNYLPNSAMPYLSETQDAYTYHLLLFVEILGQVWCNNENNEAADLLNKAQIVMQGMASLDQGLLAHWCEQVIHHLNNSQNKSSFISSNTDYALVNISTLIYQLPSWELALDKLIAMNPKSLATQTVQNTGEQSLRIIWELHNGRFEDKIVPREQKQTKSGWSKGRIVSLKSMSDEHGLMPHLCDTDIRICEAIEKKSLRGYYSKNEYILEGLSALKAACEIDNLYHANDLSTPITLTASEPELVVSEQGSHICLSLSDMPQREDESRPYELYMVNRQQYRLCVFLPAHLQVAKVLGEGGLLVPISAKQKALEGIAAIAPVLNIRSDVPEIDTGLSVKECDPYLVVNLQPYESGLSFQCVVMPFSEDGAAYPPGVGNASLSAEINGKRIAVHRDLLNEQHLLDELDAACPSFLTSTDNHLFLPDPQQAMATLQELQSAQQQQTFPLKLRWPVGKKVTISPSLTPANMQLAMTKNNEWFDITGQLQLDNDEVINLRELLKLVRASHGRFIALDSQQVLALTQDLRDKFDMLNQVLHNDSFHPLATPHIEKAISGMRMKTIPAWEAQTRKMHESNHINVKVPSTLKASLRDYQLEGFDWAMRLAHWGGGACLADDMGLGKTLQALAVMLARAEKGPSLVLAPTSVCFNWQQEIHKFAPTLNVTMLNEASGKKDRKALMQSMQAHDCLIVSYGLLQREAQLLSEITWATLVADEAQALKNPMAKRTKAAYELSADFKMITTGTPIENDLSELWSLFRIINPGLLGNLKSFAKDIIQPIEDEKQDKMAARKARQGLKNLIQPFMLRRLKSQVLMELPPRTEISITVTLSEQEQAFYEALRQNAIELIQHAAEQQNKGEQRIRMLAELTKLRQACCHPKLVHSTSDVPSSKLDALDNLLDELLANQHKTLIFSQFVGHLQLIKQHLESKGIRYQYLDGSTPQKARQTAVNAFQAGEGDVFLISLKAGGFGLNLTAADYVIHMDPWWNPAVEDQASDRAHRMGQTRPVTIYRLITQNTIEEKIMSLHQTKRDLADQVLAGNDTALKLSVEDMLLLLKKPM